MDLNDGKDNGWYTQREARGFSLLAAEALLERFHEKAKIIQAWGDLADPEQAGRMIIDCNMNLPLLYWATEQTGDLRFADAAKAHVMQAATYLIREDASTFHTYYMDVKTGAPRYGNTQQGYADDSCWSRDSKLKIPTHIGLPGGFGFQISTDDVKPEEARWRTKG
jgi:hypothetical protein